MSFSSTNTWSFARGLRKKPGIFILKVKHVTDVQLIYQIILFKNQMNSVVHRILGIINNSQLIEYLFLKNLKQIGERVIDLRNLYTMGRYNYFYHRVLWEQEKYTMFWFEYCNLRNLSSSNKCTEGGIRAPNIILKYGFLFGYKWSPVIFQFILADTRSPNLCY